MIEFTTTIEIDDSEVEVVVTAEIITPAYAGTWYARNGDPGDAPEPAEIEITCIEGPDEQYDLSELPQSDQRRLEGMAADRAESAANIY